MITEEFQNSALYVGIDAHREEHTAVMATRFEEERGNLTFANDRQGINQFLSWLRQTGEERKIIGIEGGGRTRNALVTCLLNQTYPVFEVNPLYTKQRRGYGTRGDKSDILDAKLVVEVLTRKLNRLSKLNPADYSPARLTLTKTTRFYEELAWQRTRLKNQLKSLLKERQLAQDGEERRTLDLIIREKKKELTRIGKLETKFKQRLSLLLERQGSGNLTTMKGISTVLAARIIAQTGDIRNFANLDKFIKYAGIAPLEESSGKTRGHRKNRTGNRRLNSAFYLLALNQLRWNTQAKEYFQKKIREGKTKKQALRCLMKRVACIVYGLLKSGESYRG
ncbi:IS110 family transposase [Candidatus Shapirobacteria bacterium]|nr:IS110 family transposase [Candidatus Shapirobacteria bacterium]